MRKEIQLAHVHLETLLTISDEYVQMLIIENPTEFYNMVSDLDRQFDGQEGQFVFSIDDQIVPASKYGAMISDLFHFDLNDKKLLALLYKRLEGVAFGEKIALFNELTAKAVPSIKLHRQLFLMGLKIKAPREKLYPWEKSLKRQR